MTLKAWIDPADDNVRTEASGRVTAVDDKSLEGNDVAEAGSSGPPPTTINGLTALDHLGAGGVFDGLETAADISYTGPDVTIVVAYSDTAVGSGTTNNVMVGASTVTAATGFAVYRPIGSSNLQLKVQNQVATVTPVGATANNVDIFAGRYDAARNFVQAILNGGEGEASASATTDPGLAQQFSVGNYENTNGGWEQGAIAEVILFDGVLKYDDLQRCEGYLAHKWGAVDSLPADHPFKLVGPDIVKRSALVANFFGTDGATAYTAESGDALTFIGASLSNRNPVFGPTSLDQADGSNGSYFPGTVDNDLSNTAFTVEAWCNFDDTNQADYPILGKWNFSTSNRSYLLFYQGAEDTLDFLTSNNGAATLTQITHSSFIPNVGQWYHFAVSWDGTTLRMFIDGVLVETATPGPLSIFVSTADLGVGSFATASAADQFDGLIGPVRITVDECLYVADFPLPPREFLYPEPAALIANFAGQDTDTAYTSEDDAARVATFVGNAQLDSAQTLFGPTSLLLDGAGDSVNFPTSADFDFGAGDFTVEAFIRLTSASATNALLGVYPGGTDDSWSIRTSSSRLQVFFTLNGSSDNFITGTAGPTLSDATWHHVAWCREGATNRLFIDGVALTVSDALGGGTLHSSSGVLDIGVRTGFDPMDGNITGVRIVKGSALYVAAFDPPVYGVGEPII